MPAHEPLVGEPALPDGRSELPADVKAVWLAPGVKVGLSFTGVMCTMNVDVAVSIPGSVTVSVTAMSPFWSEASAPGLTTSLSPNRCKPSPPPG